jgi:hypothetical protein
MIAAPVPFCSRQSNKGRWTTIDEMLKHVALPDIYMLILIEKGAAKMSKKTPQPRLDC